MGEICTELLMKTKPALTIQRLGVKITPSSLWALSCTFLTQALWTNRQLAVYPLPMEIYEGLWQILLMCSITDFVSKHVLEDWMVCSNIQLLLVFKDIKRFKICWLFYRTSLGEWASLPYATTKAEYVSFSPQEGPWASAIPQK